MACVRFESPFEWEQRVSKDFTQADRISQVVGTGPKCLEPSVLEIKGMSLGETLLTATNGKYSSEGAAREWSTVVDISIIPPSFKPVSWSLSRSPLF